MYSVAAEPAEKQLTLDWLSDARRKVLLAYQGDNQFLLATRRLSISPAQGLGDLKQIEKQFSQLSALSSGLR
jgi:hypothetical protein